MPKGKVEKNEDFARAAVREIKEETGVEAKITGFLCSTFHTYSLKDKFVLKETKWYLLSATNKAKLKAQTEEGITEVAWLGREDVDKIKSETYASIKGVVNAYIIAKPADEAG